MIVVFEFFGQMVRKDACLFSTEVSKSYIQNMSSMHLQYKYNIPEICTTTISKNYLKFADRCGK